MNVRAPHGRTAAMRSVWGWAIRSPRRLLAVAIVLLAVSAGLGMLLSDGDSDTPSVTSAEATASPDRLAWAFTVAWVTHPPGTTSAERVDRLRPYTDPEFIPELETVDPENVPSKALSGPPRIVAVGDQSATVDVPTDGAVLRIQLNHTDSGWRVSSYSEAE